MPPLDPDVADPVTSDSALTAYDQRRAVTYMRLLDADAEGADWREVARIVLRIDRIRGKSLPKPESGDPDKLS